MSTRQRVGVVLALALVLIAASVATVLRSRADHAEQARTAPARATVGPADLRPGPRIVFRNATLGADLGRVAMVSLADPGGPRAFTDLTCDRVFATVRDTLCLASARGVATTYSAAVYDANGSRIPLPLAGSPSRARLSADGRLAATTSFVAGDSYAAASFSTRTVITDLDRRSSADLEDFTLLHDGRRITPVDRNFWGVTFAPDDDRFYVTVAFGGSTHLAEGRISTRTVQTLRSDAECPSLSPDGTRIAYKKLAGRSRGDWRIAMLDLANGRERVLPETRSVDDQVEWLDDDTIIYGMPGTGTLAAQTGVWRIAADGSAGPVLLIPDAWSPAVVR